MSDTSTDGTEHTECAVCGYEPDPDRVPPHYVLSLSEEDIDDEYVQSYPFGGSVSVPFACSDECWLDAQDDRELIADGGQSTSDTERVVLGLEEARRVANSLEMLYYDTKESAYDATDEQAALDAMEIRKRGDIEPNPELLERSVDTDTNRSGGRE